MAPEPPAAEPQPVGMVESFRGWLKGVWNDIKAFASRVWETAKGLCEFAKDAAKLVWAWLFKQDDEYAAERLRFKAKYCAVQLDPAELANALAVSLSAR